MRWCVAGMMGWMGVAVATAALAQGPAYRDEGPAPSNRRPAQPSAPGNNARPPQGVDPRLAGPVQSGVPQAPPWWPQSAAHQKYLDEVLTFWEQSSQKVERYRTQFVRWEYDPAFGPKPDPVTGKRDAVRISYGEIKYAQPDKGTFKVAKILHYNPPKVPGEKPLYLALKGEEGEHWVCNGKSVFEFDHQGKKLVEHQLPPEMQGKAIVDGPLPFLFGAEAEKIKQRYWIGVVTPKDAKGEYWLEAWPKYREDYKNYRRVEVIIDEADFLPKAIQIYDHNGASTVITFDKREVNFSISPLGGLDPLRVAEWMSTEFKAPATPFGYKKETIRFDAAAGQQGPPGPRSTQAIRGTGPQVPLRKQ